MDQIQSQGADMGFAVRKTFRAKADSVQIGVECPVLAQRTSLMSQKAIAAVPPAEDWQDEPLTPPRSTKALTDFDSKYR
jgi:hypothetical protein